MGRRRLRRTAGPADPASRRDRLAEREHAAALLHYHQVVSDYWAAPDGVGSVFKRYLHSAITDGVRPPRASRLGPRTSDAIERVADDHPEAAVDLIADAYDAFASEHKGVEVPAADLSDAAATTPAKSSVTRRKRVRVR
jgi:hypothetical protein